MPAIISGSMGQAHRTAKQSKARQSKAKHKPSTWASIKQARTKDWRITGRRGSIRRTAGEGEERVCISSGSVGRPHRPLPAAQLTI